jgi:hypothetical protein
LDIGAGSVEIAAGDRTDTVVEVRPANPERKSDVAACEAARVEYHEGTLTVKTPRTWRQYVAWRDGGSVRVDIAVPSGSRVRGELGVGNLRTSGRLGDCVLKSGAGDVHVGEAGPVQVRSGAGDITVESAMEHCEVSLGSGAVQVARVDGPAVVKNANGDVRVGDVLGGLRATTANGRIWVGRAASDVEAKTANGSVRIDEVASGRVSALTAMGKVEIGIRHGVAALLDVETSWGKVLNGLEASGPPAPGTPSVEVRARTSFGDVRIFRSAGPDLPGPGGPRDVPGQPGPWEADRD